MGEKLNVYGLPDVEVDDNEYGILDNLRDAVSDMPDYLRGAEDVARTFASSIASEAPAGLYGLSGMFSPSYARGGRTRMEEARRRIDSAQNAMTIMPESEQGKRNMQGIADTIAPVGNWLAKNVRGRYEAKANPAVGAAAAGGVYALMSALSEVVPNPAKGAKVAGRAAGAATNMPTPAAVNLQDLMSMAQETSKYDPNLVQALVEMESGRPMPRADKTMIQDDQPLQGAYTDAEIAKQMDMPVGSRSMGKSQAGVIGYHGSPHRFDQFSSGAIGTGEGAQAYGYGLYFAENQGTAGWYRDKLAGGSDVTFKGEKTSLRKDDPQSILIDEVASIKRDPLVQRAIESGDASYNEVINETLDHWAKSGRYDRKVVEEAKTMLPNFNIDDVENVSRGHLYEVDIPDAKRDKMLDWDAPVSEQPALQDLIDNNFANEDLSDMTGRDLYYRLTEEIRDNPEFGEEVVERELSRILPKYGIPGDIGMTENVYGFMQRLVGEGATKKMSPEDRQIFAELMVDNPERSASTYLNQEFGIPGIRFLDGNSRGDGEGSRNMVLFDPNDIDSVKRDGEIVYKKRGEKGSAGSKAIPEDKFYSDYYMHTDIRGAQGNNADANRESIMRDGFRPGMANVLPASVAQSGGAKGLKQFAPKEGQTVYLMPKDQVGKSAGGGRAAVAPGWKPDPSKGGFAVTLQPGESLYDAYKRTVNEGQSANAMNEPRQAKPLGAIMRGQGGSIGGRQPIGSTDTRYSKRGSKLEEQKLAATTRDVESREIQGARNITLSDLEGKPVVFSMSDRSDAGNKLVGINGVKFKESVNLTGGQDFKRDNTDRGLNWASGGSQVSNMMNVANRLYQQTGESPLHLPYRMSPKSSDFSTMPMQAMFEGLRTIPRKRWGAANDMIRKYIPGFKSIQSKGARDQILKLDANGRAKLMDEMDLKFRDDIGFGVGEARLAITDPKQIDAPDAGLQNVSQFDMSRPTERVNNPSYPVATPGEYVGTLDTNANVWDMLPEQRGAEGRVVDARGEKFDPTDMYTLRMQGALGTVITEDLLRQLQAKGVKIASMAPAGIIAAALAAGLINEQDAEKARGELRG